MDILDIRAHAHRCADSGRPSSECPFAVTSIDGMLWLEFYFARKLWLSAKV